MQTSEGELRYQDLLWLLGSLCNPCRLSFNPGLIGQQYPPPATLATFHETARALGFKTGRNAHPKNCQQLPLPSIAFLSGTLPSDAAAEQDGQTATEVATHPVLILMTDGQKLLYFRSGSQTPETLTVD